MLLAQTASYQNGVKKRTFEPTVVVGQVSIKFVMIGLASALALLYLAQSTQGAHQSYQLRELEQERKNLVVQQERLDVEVTRLKSLEILQEEVKPDPANPEKPVAWENVDQVAHVTAPTAVANRRP